MATLVCFDIDGTLVTSVGDTANKLHKRAFSHAIKSVYGIDTSVDVIKHHGGTDPLILKAVLEHHGRPGDEVMSKLPELQDAMVEFALSQPLEEASRGIGLLPGVRDTLAALADAPGVVPCLVTGNLEPIGWLKMRALGLLPSFGEEPFGGFGSDFCSGNVAEMWKDRAELIRVAQRKASKLMAGQGALERIYHVGDTPMDIKAAVAAGATAVGVCTGVFGRGELVEALGDGEGVVLDGMDELLGTLAQHGVPVQPPPSG